MKTIHKSLNITIDINQYFPNMKADEVLFFDIETTGFDSNREYIYLIGCIYYEHSIWKLVQLFSQNGENGDEKLILTHFFELVKHRNKLMHFNGDTFDIRFILKRAEILGMSTFFNPIESIDFYKIIKKYKNIFNLENYKLKTIERFLNIEREDIYTGGELIQVYKNYIHNKSLELEKSLLLHNEEDLYGLINIVDIMKYILCVDQLKNNSNFTVSDYEIDQEFKNITFYIIPQIVVNFNTFIKYKTWNCTFDKENNIIVFNIELSYGIYHHFFENYKDYFYIPKLDEAMHKSISKMMDKKDLVKANKSNCYIKKEGYFIEVFSKNIEHTFVDLNHKKDIYIPVIINEYKYLKQDTIINLVTSFLEVL
jgi:uncharacterized protein YprB with RNaseH-like and TPR domain